MTLWTFPDVTLFEKKKPETQLRVKIGGQAVPQDSNSSILLHCCDFSKAQFKKSYFS
jgi:hypothetical protein